MIKRGLSLVLVVVLTLSFNFVTPISAKQDSSEVHYLSFGSDRHGNATNIYNSMNGMPKNVEYVSIVGDMVGDMTPRLDEGGETQTFSEDETYEHNELSSNMKPSFFSSTIYDEVMSVGFNKVFGNKEISLLWADHDVNVKGQDDAGVIFGMDCVGSGLMKTGYNYDGSEAYYIYGIAFYEIEDEAKAKIAAEQFKKWVDTVAINNSVPLIVECHMPLHYARKDNKGANAWTEALNYAATGKTNPGDNATVIRNVIYLFGHNHTVEFKSGEYSGEFFVPVGANMEIGATADVWSKIYFTYTNAGFIRDNCAASLVSIWDKTITIKKYQNGQVVDNLYDTESKSSGKFATEFKTEGINQIPRVSIIKIANTATFKVKKKTVKYKKLYKKKQVVKPFTVKKAKGTVTYTKKSGSKKLIINKKTGKVTVKKKTKKGTYKIKVIIKVAGTELYKTSTKTLTAKVKVVK